MKHLLSISLLLASCAIIHAADPYEGYSSDRELLRSTTEIPAGSDSDQNIKSSSAQATQAAHRLFSRVSFLFMSRDEVLEILGDPATISDYGIKAKAEKDSDLVYRFDSGFGGWQFTIKFRDGRVWATQADGID